MPWLDLPFCEVALEEVYKRDASLRKDDVETILKWAEVQPHLPRVTELQVLLFVHTAFYNTELAKKNIDRYFTAKTLSPDIFGSRTLKDPLFSAATKCVFMAPLVSLTPCGDLVIIGRLLDFQSSNYNPIGHMRLFDIITLLYLHQNGPVNGVQIVADMSHASLSHFFKFSPAITHRFLEYFQELMPIRIRYLHVIHVAYFIDKILAFVKPLIKKEVFDLIKIHSSLEELYQYIPQGLLPADYGGSAESTDILKDKVIRLIESSEEFLMYQEGQLVDESKRPKLLDRRVTV